MTLSSDQNINPSELSPTARRMLELREEVLLEWGKRVRQTVKEAEKLPQPILIDTFPVLYDNLAEAITPDYPRTTGNEGNTVAGEHGGERARLTHYNVHAVIAEYQILRWTIFDVLKQKEVLLTDDEYFVINASIDGSIREAVTAFALTQLALRERFMAALTHDLRNPLSNALVSAELIKRSSDPEKINRLAEMIINNLNRMDGMIRDLLDSIRFQTGERLQLHLEEFDMHDVVKEVCDQFSVTYGPRFQIIGSGGKGCWDRNAIKRAIENLLGNAVKYGSPNTPIRSKIDSISERVMVSIHNEGDPIPPDQVESIFQVFRRADAAKEGKADGWGIGLPYVRSVVESHGGSIAVDSSASRGTTFVLDIPANATAFLDAPVLSKKGE